MRGKERMPTCPGLNRYVAGVVTGIPVAVQVRRTGTCRCTLLSTQTFCDVGGQLKLIDEEEIEVVVNAL
jgi:hypothetical protein